MYEESYYLRNIQVKLESSNTESPAVNEAKPQKFENVFKDIYNETVGDTNSEYSSSIKSNMDLDYDSEHLNKDEDISIDIVEHPIKIEHSSDDEEDMENTELDENCDVINNELGISKTGIETQNPDNSNSLELTNNQLETENGDSNHSIESATTINTEFINADNSNSSNFDTESKNSIEYLEPEYFVENGKGSETSASFYKCPFCALKFQDSDEFRKHLHITSKTYISKYKTNSVRVCVKCNFNYSSPQVPHKRICICTTRPKSKLVGCKSCQKNFRTYCRLNSHQNTDNHDKNVLKCYLCGERFCNEIFLKEHASSTHSNKLLLECQECEKCFSNMSELVAHFNKYPITKIELRTARNNTYFTKNLNHTCNKYLFSEIISSEIKISKTFHNERKYVECIDCKFKFSNTNYLNQHYVSQHVKNRVKKQIVSDTNVDQRKTNGTVQRTKKDINTKKIGCSECKAKFSSKKDLILHLTRHYNYYFCHHCLALYNTKYNLKKHIVQIHIPKRNFECKKCKQKFHESQDLKNHDIKVHSRSQKSNSDCYFPALSRFLTAGSSIKLKK